MLTRPAALIVSALVVLVAHLVVPSSTASAADGYTLAADSVFRVIDDGPTVAVDTTYRMTNVTPDQPLGGGRYEYYFFTGLSVPLTEGATGVSVTVDGREASFEQLDDQGFRFLDIALGDELRYQQTATVMVSYTLAGAPPRTDDSFVRINPAYLSFPAWVHADDGLGSIRIEIPDRWTVDHVGSDLRSSVADGIRILAADEIADNLDFWIAFTARDDERLSSTPVAVGDAAFEVRSWPGDDEWAEFARRHLSTGIPILEDLVGAPWPEREETDVVEASTPYLRGYAGYYYAAERLIEVGEDLDSLTMLHELSHAWFNSSGIDDRWLSEGLAEAVSDLAVDQLGDVAVDPDDELDGEVDADTRRQAIELNLWGAPIGDDDATESYGYETSFAVIRDLFDEIGPQRRTELLTAVVEERRAYGGDGETEIGTGRISWREFLDLAEQLGGSTTLEAVYRELVVTDAQLDELDRRATSVAAYAELVERGAGWLPPEAVRSDLAAWRFIRADEAIEVAARALDRRDELSAVLAPLALVPAAAAETAYERADDDLSAVFDLLDDHLGAATELAADRTALTDLLERLELDVPPLTQSDYDADPTGIAEVSDDQLADAEGLADADAALRDLLDPIEVDPPELAADAFVAGPDRARARVDEWVAAAEHVARAHAARDDADSIIDWVGALGSEVDSLLDEADTAMEQGDAVAATAAADEAVAAADELGSTGTTRLAIIGGGIVVLFAVGVVAGRRRRRDRSAADDDADTDDTGGIHDGTDDAADTADTEPLRATVPDAIATGATSTGAGSGTNSEARLDDDRTPAGGGTLPAPLATDRVAEPERDDRLGDDEPASTSDDPAPVANAAGAGPNGAGPNGAAANGDDDGGR